MTIKNGIYVTDDGREFTNFEECVSYERELGDIIKALKKLKEKCELTDVCESCPFFRTDLHDCAFQTLPSIWAI